MNMKHILLAAALVAVPATSAFAQTTKYERHHIAARKENQQDRIAQGVKSGQLTPRETARLETKEARLNRQVRRDRVGHDGRLTPVERAQVNREQNRLSRDIYREKHNFARQ